ncbi:MAG: hypothetical protein PVH47_03700 [Thiohalocapsa sp.]|jgi:hypothetical protein
MYHVMLVECRDGYLARRLAVAATAAEAQRLALRLEHEVDGAGTGRTFYLDCGTYRTWRRKGKIAPPEAFRLSGTDCPEMHNPAQSRTASAMRT